MSIYCNTGCKNTIYEDGDKYSDDLEAYERNEMILKKLLRIIKKLLI